MCLTIVRTYINKRTSKSFDLVHSGVQDSCPITFKFEYKYFFSFMNDNSHVTWIYLLKFCSEVFSTFKK